jgi:hypothetical protein
MYFLLDTDNHRGAINSLGVYVDIPKVAAIDYPQQIFQLLDLAVFPVDLRRSSDFANGKITKLWAEERGERETKHVRLCWSINAEQIPKDEKWCLPRSNVTGPFSHFEIEVDGKPIYTAHSFECILHKTHAELWKAEGIAVNIFGVLFNGKRTEPVEYRLKQEDKDWVML